MPKPIFGLPGNGMHIHQSLWQGDKNLFYDPEGVYFLSPLALQFIAGQLHHAPALSALVSPTVNSGKRLVPGFEAPVYICWGQTNRSALVRIPQVPQKRASQATRAEYRAADPSANPYLAFAALLAAGLDGIEKKMKPPQSMEKNVYHLNHHQLTKNNIRILPQTLGKAIQALEKDEIVLNILGNSKKRYLEIKTKEWQQFNNQVTKWEVDRYL
jgi:glutamine synthetase